MNLNTANLITIPFLTYKAIAKYLRRENFFFQELNPEVAKNFAVQFGIVQTWFKIQNPTVLFIN